MTTFNHEECYFKRFGKERPDDIRPIEERIEEMERKRNNDGYANSLEDNQKQMQSNIY